MVVKDSVLLRTLFTAKGLFKQKQIAAALSVTEDSVVRWLQGKPMHSGQAQRVANFLGKPVEDLFEVKQAAPLAPAQLLPDPPLPLDDADREWGRESARKLGYSETK